MATIASAEASPAAQAKRRGRPPKAPLAAEVEAPRTPSPVSPLTAAAEGYEREREARIKENMERMQKLGLVDLATRFNQSATPTGTGTGRGLWRRRPETPGSPAAAAPRIKSASPMPARRSLRFVCSGSIFLACSFSCSVYWRNPRTSCAAYYSCVHHFHSTANTLLVQLVILVRLSSSMNMLILFPFCSMSMPFFMLYKFGSIT